jgi:hypothetical protein
MRVCIADDDFGRYSNTLLVSLNNRISIRETMEVANRSPAESRETFPVTPLSQDSMDSIIQMTPTASQTDSEKHEGVVVGEWCGFSLRLWLTHVQLTGIT